MTLINKSSGSGKISQCHDKSCDDAGLFWNPYLDNSSYSVRLSSVVHFYRPVGARWLMWSILQRCLNFPRTLSFVSNLGWVDLAAWANYLFPQFHSYEKSNSWSLDTQATMLCATVLTFLTAFISKETSWNPFLAGLTWDTDQIKKSILTAAEGRDHLLSA